MKLIIAAFAVALALLTVACGEDTEPTTSAGAEENAETEADPTETVAEIKRLLDEILTTYEEGDAEAAAELSAEAYLENYEHIEDAVIDAAPEVNEELETLLGADLRQEISDGAPIEEIEQMVTRARELLDDALAAIT